MRNILVLIVAFLFAFSAQAMTIKIGSKHAGKITEESAKNAINAGSLNVQGVKIVYKKGLTVPTTIKQKWDAAAFSGQTAPSSGEESDDVVFIESF